MTDSSSSQIGGESNLRAIEYQKKFVAYLCVQMLRDEKIKKVTCEHLNDIEVQHDSKLIYYQIKSTSRNTLPKSEILDSFRLFLSNDNYAKGKSTDKEYVLVSNAKISSFHVNFERHSFSELDDKTKHEIRFSLGLDGTNDFLKRTFLMKGPLLEEIESVIVTNLLAALMKRGQDQYAWFKIKDSLLSYINNMCPGPTDLKDMAIVDADETEEYYLKHKTVTLEILNRIIEEHRRPSFNENLVPVSNTFTHRYKIRVQNPEEEELERIFDFIDEFDTLSDDQPDLKLTYLRKLNDKSIRYNLHNNRRFLQFLSKLIHESNDKHIIWESLLILSNLITTSKTENETSFKDYVNKEYFDLFKQRLEARDQIFDYSLSKIQEIFDEIKETLNPEQLCDMYWKRMVKIIRIMRETGETDKSLWNCIVNLNKCRIKKEWRKWLISKDEFSEIKSAVLKELEHLI